MTITRIVLSDTLTAAQFVDKTRLFALERPATVGLATHIHSIAAGVNSGLITVQVGATQATATVTFTGAPTADETLSVANVVLTAKASGATGPEFNIGGSTTITATNLTACINSLPALSGIVTATSELGVVTITSVVPGKVGSAIQLSEALSNTTAAGFSASVDGSQFVLDLA